MNDARRTLRIRLPLLAALAAVTGPSFAQAYPSRPVRLVLPYPPGGGTDVFARTVAPKLGEVLGQQVVVENRPGGSGIVAVEYLKSQPADGYTVMLGDMGQYALNSSLFRKLPYDPQTDLAPVGLTARFEFLVVVNPAVIDVGTVAQLVEAGRKAPGGLQYASPGVGVPHHLAMELFAHSAGLKVTPVHYKGGGPAMQGLLGGETGLMMLDVVSALPHLKAGKLRALATPSGSRVELLPEVPTLGELGMKGTEIYAWQGLSMRAGAPEAAIAAVGNAYRRAVEDPTLRKTLLDRGGIRLTPSSPAEMASYAQAETVRWREVIRRNNISIES